MTRLFFQAIAIIALLHACEGTAFCGGTGLSEADINNKVLATVNGYRSKLTKGEQRNGHNGTNLPPGKNMNKLSWSCNLESEAAKIAGDTCPEEKPQSPNNALVFLSEYDYNQEDIAFMLTSLLEGINNVPLQKIAGPVQYSMEPQLESYANLMKATATQIGCKLNRCTEESKYALYCLTDQPPIKDGETIYEIGTTTTTDCRCDTEGFVCDRDGFCVPGSTTTTTASTTTSAASALGATLPTGGTNNICMNMGMTDSLRTKFLDMHNYRRSLLATGKIAKNNGNLLPTAQNMARMQYNCNLEAEALSYARQCPQSGSGGGNNGENFILFSSAGITSFENAVNKAVTSWWKVVRQHPGIGMKAMFRAHHVGAPIASFTQMAWATSRQLGCSIVQCASNYVAVCRYSEKGNMIERNVYIPGTICAMCSGMCNTAEGLCP